MSNRIKSTDILSIVRCNVGHEIYGLDMSWILNIEQTDHLRRVSEKGASNVGFIGWLPGESSDIPVFSLAKRLGRDYILPIDEDLQRIIILPAPVPPGEDRTQEDHLWALLVDQVSQVFEVSGERFEQLPEIAINPKRNYFEGVIKTDDELLLFLSPEWLHPDTLLYVEGIIEKPYSLEAQVNAWINKIEIEQEAYSTKNETTNVKPYQPDQTVTTNGKRLSARLGRLITFSTQKQQANGRPLMYGLSITQVPEILRSLPLTPVPAAPEYVLGLVNWRDRVVPVVDLDARMGLTSSGTTPTYDNSRLIIARGRNETLVSFPIQPSVRALRLPVPHRPVRQMPEIDKNFVRGMVELEDLTLVIPNIQDILS